MRRCCRRVAVLVYRVCGRLRRDEVADRVKEVFNEAVQPRLASGSTFDPQRSATAWLMGFALHILQEQRRPRRAVVQSDLGEEAWRAALADLCSADDADAATIRLDIRQALARLDEPQRRVAGTALFRGAGRRRVGESSERAIVRGRARAPDAGAASACGRLFGASGGEESHD